MLIPERIFKRVMYYNNNSNNHVKIKNYHIYAYETQLP